MDTESSYELEDPPVDATHLIIEELDVDDDDDDDEDYDEIMILDLRRREHHDAWVV